MGVLEEKVAIITGGAGGIGLDIARAYLREGAQVGLLDIDATRLAEAARKLPGATTLACDVADRAQVRQVIDAYAAQAGGLDILVNNAAYFYYAPLADMPEDKVDRMIDVGLKGALWSLQAATPHLIARGGGAVINLSSVAVSVSIKNAAVYSAIKGALDTLTRQQATELGAYGVRVNALAPGPVVTPGASSVISEEGWDMRRRRTPLNRLAVGGDIAEVALFLASPASAMVAGVTLKVDGAMTVLGY
ncbi:MULTISPECIES: SDR family NAD(P)-dependent oxidoreductase [unclassified Achromobacter]|uniref:SDR family NAD(P)-dependent oxidoreductase n=1 Tax=unclassified Achromobacter TaxID=2626865 RepID=UPI000B516015|nr:MULTISPECIES: SDR family oxidoreductase [unclassified Achromobacter]OWT73690.1 short-chain dehydrogenase [Achromobacter sp. HZ34]OWT79394.1 short-chain dehydrogenase [Achromobacter sp. HZ28]